MKHFLLVCLVLASFNAFSQQLINGYVVDAQTQEPLAGATIRIFHTTESVKSDRTGRFTLQSVQQADSIIITHTGYTSVTQVVDKKEMRISLQPVVNLLNDVVISASRAAQPRKNVPAAISKVNAQTIEETRATALYQLMNKVSGVYMVNLGNEQHTMAIRQPITYNALYLYLEDGLPIRPTGIFNHNALYEINMNGVRDIEVIKGPSSSLYGSNSIGGAVNFSSLVPEKDMKQQLSVQGDGYHYYRTDASGGFTSGKWGVAVNGYAARQQNSWQDYTDFDKYSGSVKSTYDINASNRLSVMATYNYLNTQTPGSLDSARFYKRSYSSNQRFTYRKVQAFRTSARLDHRWDNQNASFLTVFFRDNSTGQLPSYFIQDIRNSAGQYLRSAGQENNQSFRSYGFLLQHRADLGFLNSRLIGGVYLDDSPSSFYAKYLNINKDVSRNYYTNYTNTDSLIDHYKIKLLNAAAYLQYEMHPVEPLRIVAGLRYDRLVYDFENGLPAGRTRYKQQQTDHYGIFAPKLGATYNLGKGIGLYANFSLGFQPPETSSLYSSRQSNVLKQASFYNYELGGWLPLLTEKLNLELSVYDMEGRNEMISVLMPDNTTQNQNAGATRHRGIEYNLSYTPSADWLFRFGGTNARHTYTKYSELVFGKTVIYDGNRMVNAPNWIANTEFVWKPAFVKGLRAGVEWQHIGKYFVNTANTRTYKGYDLLNLRTGYSFTDQVAKGASIWFNVINLSNELYATTVTGNQYGVTYNAAAPRTFSLGLSYALPTHRN